jgi:putative transposase
VKLTFIGKNEELPLIRQCWLLSFPRNKLYYTPRISKRNLELMHRIDELYTEDPTRGTRRLSGALLRRFNLKAGRGKVRRLMMRMGISAIYPKKRLSFPNKQHKIYPYLLRNVAITRVNQVWSTDITYIRLKNGYVYLMAIVDWYSRYVLSWRLSTTLDAGFCVDALKEAIAVYGTPEIFNTDQGSQFTCDDFIQVLKNNKIKISMDGKGRALDNVFVERLWRTVKHEDIYLKEYRTVKECKQGLTRFFHRYNNRREHSSLDYYCPEQIYFGKIKFAKAA